MKKNKKYVIVQPALEYNDNGYSPSFSELFWGEYQGLINLFDTEQDAQKGLEMLTYNLLTNADCTIWELCDYNTHLEVAFGEFFDDENYFNMEFGSDNWNKLYPQIKDYFCHMDVVEVNGNKFQINIDDYFGHFKIKNGEIVAHNPKGIALGYKGYEDEGRYFIDGQYIEEEDFPAASKKYLIGDGIKKILEV